MLLCSPLLQLRLTECDRLLHSTCIVAVFRLLLLGGGGGDDGMIAVRRLGDACCPALPVDCERSASGADGSMIAELSDSQSVGMIRRGSVRFVAINPSVAS